MQSYCFSGVAASLLTLHHSGVIEHRTVVVAFGSRTPLLLPVASLLLDEQAVGFVCWCSSVLMRTDLDGNAKEKGVVSRKWSRGGFWTELVISGGIDEGYSQWMWKIEVCS